MAAYTKFSNLFLADNCLIGLGNTKAAPDVTVGWDGAALEILPVADDTGAVNIGDGTTDLDVKAFLGAATQYALFDVGNIRLDLHNVQLYPTGTAFGGNAVVDFAGVTLATSQNLIRGVGVAPTRASGWTSFSGTITTTPAQVYTDYRELHTAGVAEILGFGSFPFADSGASIASMFAGQDIVEVDAGAVVLASTGPGSGIFGRFIKVLLNGETFTSGGVAANLWLSFQANVTDVKGEDTSFVNMEIASGGIRSVFKLQVTGGAGATYLLDLTDDVEPVIDDPTLYRDPNAATADKGLVVRIGSTLYMIPLYVHD